MGCHAKGSRMFDDNLIRGQDQYEEKAKITMAFVEGNRVKRLIGHLQYLFRNSTGGSTPRITKLKLLLPEVMCQSLLLHFLLVRVVKSIAGQ